MWRMFCAAMASASTICEYPPERASAFLSEMWIRQDPQRTASALRVAHGKAHLVDVALAANFRRLGMGCAIFDMINSRLTGAYAPQAKIGYRVDGRTGTG